MSALRGRLYMLFCKLMGDLISSCFLLLKILIGLWIVYLLFGVKLVNQVSGSFSMMLAHKI